MGVDFVSPTPAFDGRIDGTEVGNLALVNDVLRYRASSGWVDAQASETIPDGGDYAVSIAKLTGQEIHIDAFLAPGGTYTAAMQAAAAAGKVAILDPDWVKTYTIEEGILNTIDGSGFICRGGVAKVVMDAASFDGARYYAGTADTANSIYAVGGAALADLKNQIAFHAYDMDDFVFSDIAVWLSSQAVFNRSSALFLEYVRNANVLRPKAIGFSSPGIGIIEADSCIGGVIDSPYVFDSYSNNASATQQITGIWVDGAHDSTEGNARDNRGMSNGLAIRNPRIDYLRLGATALAACGGMQTDGITLAEGQGDVTVRQGVLVEGGLISRCGEGIDIQSSYHTVSRLRMNDIYQDAIKLVYEAHENVIRDIQVDGTGLRAVILGGSTHVSGPTGNLIDGVRGTRIGAIDLSSYPVGVSGLQATLGFIETDTGSYNPTDNVISNCFAKLSPDLINVIRDQNSVGSLFFNIEAADAGTYFAGTQHATTRVTRVGNMGSLGTTQVLDHKGPTTLVAVTATGLATLAAVTATSITASGTVLVTGTSTTFTHQGAATFGGTAVATRKLDISNAGIETFRYDDNSLINAVVQQCYGIAAAGQGPRTLAMFGTGGALGAAAGSFGIVSTDTWAAAGNRSAAFSVYTSNAGTLAEKFRVEPDGRPTFRPPASATPLVNGDLTFEATANTTVTLKLKGSDGTVRTLALTLA